MHTSAQVDVDPANGLDQAVVLLHGRGSHKDDLMGLRPGLPANAIVVTPQGRTTTGSVYEGNEGWLRGQVILYTKRTTSGAGSNRG